MYISEEDKIDFPPPPPSSILLGVANSGFHFFLKFANLLSKTGEEKNQQTEEQQ